MLWRDVYICIYLVFFSSFLGVVGIWFYKLWQLRRLIRRFGSVKVTGIYMGWPWLGFTASSTIMKYIFFRYYEDEQNDLIKQAARRARPIFLLGLILVVANFVLVAFGIFAETKHWSL